MNPQALREAVDAEIKERIAKHGWTVLAVFKAADSPRTEPPFAYSIGLTERGLPEICIMGLPERQAHGLINDVADLWMEEGVSTFNVPLQGVLKGLPVVFLEVDPEREHWYFSAARRFYGDRVKPIQMVWPDEKGLFPWQEGFNPEYQPHQVLLGDPKPVH